MDLSEDLPLSASRLYDRVKRVIPPFEWASFSADIDAILELKKRRRAVILAHNYQIPRRRRYRR
jgi:quinolinate synthase